MGMGSFWRCLAMTRNALIDLKACETADKNPVRTEPWHDLHERVVRCKERAAETRTQRVHTMQRSASYTMVGPNTTAFGLCTGSSRIRFFVP